MNPTPDDASPYKCHSRKLVCENSKFEIFFDHVEDNAGFSVPNYLVVAPKQRADNLITGTAVLPVVDGKILLLKIYRHPINAYSWEIPGGFLDPHEGTDESAFREFEEETGYTCAKENIHSLGFMTPNTGILAARIQLFAATKCQISQVFKPSEMGIRELKLFDMSEVDRMTRESLIQEPCTLIAYYRYKQGLNSQ